LYTSLPLSYEDKIESVKFPLGIAKIADLQPKSVCHISTRESM